jgi:hypothetical protein
VRYATAGLAATYEVVIGAQGGFTGTVDLSIDGLPPGATALFAPPSTSAPGGSALTVRLGPLTPPGQYTLTVTGRSGSLVHQASAILVVK